MLNFKIVINSFQSITYERFSEAIGLMIKLLGNESPLLCPINSVK
jgi:hypothetical protein